MHPHLPNIHGIYLSDECKIPEVKTGMIKIGSISLFFSVTFIQMNSVPTINI